MAVPPTKLDAALPKDTDEEYAEDDGPARGEDDDEGADSNDSPLDNGNGIPAAAHSVVSSSSK